VVVSADISFGTTCILSEDLEDIDKTQYIFSNEERKEGDERMKVIERKNRITVEEIIPVESRKVFPLLYENQGKKDKLKFSKSPLENGLSQACRPQYFPSCCQCVQCMNSAVVLSGQLLPT
jgi:hypothetical protein